MKEEWFDYWPSILKPINIKEFMIYPEQKIHILCVVTESNFSKEGILDSELFPDARKFLVLLNCFWPFGKNLGWVFQKVDLYSVCETLKLSGTSPIIN